VYNLNSQDELSLFQVGDIDDPFMPLPASKMQMNLEKDRERIDLLLDKLFNTY